MKGKYKAFVSYRHDSKSQRFAEALENELRNFARPFLSAPPRIFRDQNYLTPTLDLSKTIKDAQKNSEFLIYIASRGAAASPWVQLELDYWIRHLGRAENLIIILVDGTIATHPDLTRIDWDFTDAIPEPLKTSVHTLPYYLDLTKINDEDLDVNYAEFRHAIRTVSALFRGINPHQIEGEEARIHKSNARIKNAIIITLFVAVAAATGLALVANKQKNMANLHKNEALYALAEQYMKNSDWPEALTLTGHLLTTGLESSMRGVLEDVFGYRSLQLKPLADVLQNFQKNTVVVWEGKSYWIDKEGVLHYLSDDRVTSYHYSPETDFLVTLTGPGTDNQLSGYRIDAQGVEFAATAYELINYHIDGFYLTGVRGQYLVESVASIHEKTLLHGGGLVRVDLNSGEIGTLFDNHCDWQQKTLSGGRGNWLISDDGRYFQGVQCEGDETDRYYDLRKKPDGYRLPYYQLEAAQGQVNTKWQKLVASEIKLTPVEDLIFPVFNEAREYSSWSRLDCSLTGLGWQELEPERGEEDAVTMGITGSLLYQYAGVGRNFTLFLDPGGTCGRNFAYSESIGKSNLFSDISSNVDKLADCVDGVGPTMFSRDGRYLLVLYQASRRMQTFQVFDFKTKNIYSPDKFENHNILSNYVAFSDDHRYVAVISTENEFFRYEIMNSSECTKESDSFGGEDGKECLKLRNSFPISKTSVSKEVWSEVQQNSLHLFADRAIVINGNLISAYDFASRRREWSTNDALFGNRIMFSVASPNGKTLAVSDGEVVNILSVANGMSLTGCLLLEDLQGAAAKDDYGICQVGRASYAEEAMKTSPLLSTTTPELFWLPDDRLAIRHGDRNILVRRSPKLEMAKVSEITQRTGLNFTDEMRQLEYLPVENLEHALALHAERYRKLTLFEKWEIMSDNVLYNFRYNLSSLRLTWQNRLNSLVTDEQRGAPFSPISHADHSDVAMVGNSESSSALEYFFSTGKERFEAGQYREAIKLLSQYVAKSRAPKKITEARMYWADSLYNIQSYDQAILMYQKVMNTKMSDPALIATALLKQGNAFQELDDQETAKILYKKIVRVYPQTPSAATARKLLNGSK